MTTTASTLSENSLTTEEIITASRHLAVARGYLVESVSTLSAAQWNFRPDNDTWSIADNLEHLVLIEGRVHAIIGNMVNSPEAEPGHKESEMDGFIINEVPKRSIKVKAPVPVCPASRWTGPEGLELFIVSREQTMQLLAAPLLRGRVMPNPFFDPWDGYQWLLAVASHTIRHTRQILEVKTHPNFPQA
jgi:DinB family protein